MEKHLLALCVQFSFLRLGLCYTGVKLQVQEHGHTALLGLLSALHVRYIVTFLLVACAHIVYLASHSREA
jgi:hypothetical protein